MCLLLGASDGILPHTSSLKDANDRVTETSEALEEERRLLYVAITRAKEELYISSPQFFRGKKLDISRFYILCEKIYLKRHPLNKDVFFISRYVHPSYINSLFYREN